MSSTTYRISKPCRAITCCYGKRRPFISDVYCYACFHNVLSIWLFAVNSAFVRYNPTTLNDALVLRSRRIPPHLVLTATCLFLFLLYIAHCRFYIYPPPVWLGISACCYVSGVRCGICRLSSGLLLFVYTYYQYSKAGAILAVMLQHVLLALLGDTGCDTLRKPPPS